MFVYICSKYLSWSVSITTHTGISTTSLEVFILTRRRQATEERYECSSSECLFSCVFIYCC